MRPLSALAALVLGAAADPAQPPPAPLPVPDSWPTYRSEEDGFSIRLPPDWQLIPEFHMQRFNQGAVAQSLATEQRGPQNFKYGFQKQPIRDWFHCPFLVVDIRNTGRVPWRQLRQLPQAERVAGPAPAPLKTKTTGVFQWLIPGNVTFDRARNLVRLSGHLPIPNASPISLLAALHLTQKGIIQINAYVLEPEAAQFHEDLERIANSITVFPEIAYQKPRLETWPLLDQLDWSDPAMRYIELGIVLLLVVSLCIVAAVLYRRAAEEEDSHPLGPPSE